MYDLYLITHYIHAEPVIQVFTNFLSYDVCNGLGTVLKTYLEPDQFVVGVDIICINVLGLSL